MPFGLINPLETFQRAPEIVLSDFLWRIFLVYIDCVIVFIEQRRKFDQRDHVLSLLGEAGVKLNLNKCLLLQESFEYIVHVIGPGSLYVSKKAKENQALRDELFLQATTKLGIFLGA